MFNTLPQSGVGRIGQFIVSVVVVAILAAAVLSQAGFLKEGKDLWTRLTTSPGEEYYQSGVKKTNTGLYVNLIPAIEDFNRAIELDPDYAEVYFERAFAYAKLGFTEQMMADLDTAIELRPRYFEALSVRGISYKSLQEWDKAIADLSTAISLIPDDIAPMNEYNIYVNRGFAYVVKDMKDEAVADFTETIRIFPQSGQAYRNRGTVYFFQNRIKEAVADFELSIKYEPGYNLKGDMLTKFQEKLPQLTDPEERAALQSLIDKLERK